MGSVSEMKEKAQTAAPGRDSRVKQVFVPLAASLASGATAYAARKVVPLLRDKLESLTDGQGTSQGTGALAKARQAVTETVGSAVSGASSMLGADGEGRGSRSGARSTPRQSLSRAQREERRRRRAEHRRQRRRTLKG